MYKLLSVISVVFLSSCLFSGNIIVDEDTNAHGSAQNTNQTQDANETIKPIKITDDNVKIISQRNIITRDDKDFIIENIDSNIGDGFNLNYSLSGLSKFSTKEAREAIEALKKQDNTVVFVVYFEFNSSVLSDESKKIIAYHNDFLQKNPQLTLMLHGHTDIKGSREYNLSLGEERALSVKNIMQGNIKTVSFGEEKTISTTDSKNRRVEFIYQ
jgi:peptidoglycan-associated lipoprotein